MSRLTRRILITTAVVLVLLLALSGWFHRSTREALERAESMSFRRTTVAQQEDAGTYRFFYLSNRRLYSIRATDGSVYWVLTRGR